MALWSTLAKIVGGYFKLRVMLIIFIIFILNAGVISIQDKNYATGLKYLGNKFSKPLFDLQEQSLQIIEDKGIYKDNGEKGTFFTYVNIFWKILSSLYVLYLWLFIIDKITYYVVGSNVPPISRFLFIAFPAYILIQAIALLMQKQSPMQPIYAIRDLIKAMPYIINSMANGGEIFLNTPENMPTNKLTNITN